MQPLPIGPRLAGASPARAGEFGHRAAGYAAARGLTLDDLCAGGAAGDRSTISDWFCGKQLPSPRHLVQLIDAFRNCGHGLFYMEIKELERLWLEEYPAHDPRTKDDSGWVSQTHRVTPRRAMRSKRAWVMEFAKFLRKMAGDLENDADAAGEDGFEPSIA